MKKGKRCSHNSVRINNIKFDLCHLKSHWEPDKYELMIATLNKEFMNSTLGIDPSCIVNTKPDGACFFRTMAKLFIENPEYLDQLNLKGMETSERDQESYIAFEIQKEIIKFIAKNRDLYIRQCGQKLGEIVVDTHADNISTLEEYLELYMIFAGDSDNITNEVIGKDGKITEEKISIEDRWGSTAEQIAASLRFCLPINVYGLQKLDKRSLTVKDVTKRAKNSRLKLFQSIDPEIEGFESNDISLDIIIERTQTFPHYLYMSV